MCNFCVFACAWFFLFLGCTKNQIEYDPNPLLTLSKRKQKSTNPNVDHVDSTETTTSANCFSNYHNEKTNQIQSRDEKDANK